MDRVVEMPTNPQVFNEYSAILRRRKLHFFLPAGLILLTALALAIGLPAVYRSTAMLVIERQQIPMDLVATTVTGGNHPQN
ncbi:MAG: hypothetical protein OET63_10630 [Desulfobacterales bacterium]|nr:hypothetical protein [Desulfobacterales bacterium]